jgi:hypothetical protein
MAADKPVDFLKSRAFKAGEFQAAQRRLDELLAAFRPSLIVPIESALRAQFAGSATDGWMALARATLDDLLGGETPAEAESDEAIAPVAEELRAALQHAVPIEDADIAAEAASCAGELAHLVLSRWLDPLATAQASSTEGVALNANMLPGGLSVEQTLHDLACEAYGVDKPFVIQALRQFRDQLAQQAGAAPIELGPRLLVVVDAQDLDRPYRLFHDAAAASAFAMKRRLNPREVSQRAWEQRCATVFEVLRAGLGSYVSVVGADALGSAALGLLRETTVGTVAAQRYQHLTRSLVARDAQGAQRLLTDAVILGVDGISAGLGVGLPEVRRQWEAQATTIRAKLCRYATVRRVPVELANDVYVMIVLSGLSVWTTRGEMMEWTSGRSTEVLEELFRKYEVRDTEAAQLMDDSCLGAAMMA